MVKRTSGKRARVLGVAVVAVSALLVSACGSGGSGSGKGGGTGGSGKRGGVLTIANVQGGLWTCSFNPYNNSSNFLSAGTVYEPLMFVNELQSDKASPWLATSYAWSNGNKTLTFTIRKGVKWSDGTPMTADDVLYTFNLLKKNPALDLNSIWSVLSSAKKVGDDQVSLSFYNPALPYFYYIADQVPIVPRHIWSGIADPVSYKDDQPIGTGPYVINPCTPQNITYTANPKYWQPGLPKVTTVKYPAYTSNGPANDQLANGQAQWGSQFIPNIDKFYTQRSKDNHTWSPPTTQVSLFLNEKVAPLDNPVVRRALAYATDRQKASTIGEGGQEPPGHQFGVIPETFPSWVDPDAKAADDYSYNPQKADQLLEGLGAKKGPDGIYVLNGQKLSFSVVNQGDYGDWVATLQVVAQGMKAAGIGLTIDNLSANAYDSKLFNGDFQLAYYGETGGPTPYYELRQWLYSSNSAPIGKPAATNFERYSNPATDLLFNQYAASSDPAEQKSIIGQLEQVMLTDVPVIPVTESVAWYQYNTAKFTGWPTKADPYALPAAFNYPDIGQVLLHLQPK
ncbi:ABC transporter substrate-binding protein [Streptacidiphilus cavernicola]|uniref:ABC transporter substrate-binding protein n=1 Tax=Streptacidiphilus cavernicola TaxID=3342716 RepID=A0ABV6W309_9ACTN